MVTSQHSILPGWHSCGPLVLFLAQGSLGQFSLFQVSSKIPQKSDHSANGC